MISSRDKLVQVKFLHRVNYTPQRLHRIYPEMSPDCPSASGYILPHFLELSEGSTLLGRDVCSYQPLSSVDPSGLPRTSIAQCSG